MSKISTFDRKIKKIKVSIIKQVIRKLVYYTRKKVKNHLLEIKIRKVKFTFNSKYFFRVSNLLVKEEKEKNKKNLGKINIFFRKL